MAMHKDWMFTSFDEEVKLPESEVEYAIYQREKCPSTGKLHWQGFVRFHSRKRFTTVKKIFGPGVHLEFARCVDKAIAYCCKEDTRVASPIEIGSKPQPRKRKVDVVEQLRLCTPLQVIEENPGLWRSLRQLQSVHCALVSPRREMTTGVFLSGLTGRGKSKIASIIASYLEPHMTYWAPADLKWMDGYYGQPLVIVDEFRGGVPPSRILRLVDRYPFQAEVKGGFTQWKPKLMIMTSNLRLAHCFPEDSSTKDAIYRRINEFVVY